MCQHFGPHQGEDGEDFRRVDSHENHQPGGKRRRKQVAQRDVHPSVRPCLHARRGAAGRRLGPRAAALRRPLHHRLPRLALSCAHVPRGVVPLRAGHLHPADLLRGHWRSLAPWHSHQGRQLHGRTGQDPHRRFRQDGNADAGRVCRRRGASRPPRPHGAAPSGRPRGTLLHPPHRRQPANGLSPGARRLLGGRRRGDCRPGNPGTGEREDRLRGQRKIDGGHRRKTARVS